MPSERPRLRFQDVIDNAEAVERYIKGLDQTAFRANDLVVDAVERCLSRIREAANKLGRLAEELAPDQPWAKIRGLGNLLRHEYDIIRRDDLWAIVHDDLSSLRADCAEAIEALERRGTSRTISELSGTIRAPTLRSRPPRRGGAGPSPPAPG